MRFIHPKERRILKLEGKGTALTYPLIKSWKGRRLFGLCGGLRLERDMIGYIPQDVSVITLLKQNKLIFQSKKISKVNPKGTQLTTLHQCDTHCNRNLVSSGRQGVLYRTIHIQGLNQDPNSTLIISDHRHMMNIMIENLENLINYTTISGYL